MVSKEKVRTRQTFELIMNVPWIIWWLAALLIVFPPIALSKDDEPSDFARGVALRMERKHREAAGAFARSLAAIPENAAALVQMGASLEDMGKWKEAEQSYRRAREVDPGNSAARRNLENLQAFRQAGPVSRGPSASEEILVRKGLQALDSKNPEEALRCFELLQGLLPDDPRPMLYTAIAWERSGDKQQAQAVYRETVKAFPGFAPARVHLMVLLLESGDCENATREAKAALEAMPRDERIRYLARRLGAAMRVSEDTMGALPSPGTSQP